MPFNIPVHFVQTYTTNIEMLLQHMGGKLPEFCTRGEYVGKAVKFIEQFGSFTTSRNLPRQSPTPLSNPLDDARWVAPADHDVGVLIDNQDKLRMLIDPKSAYTMNMVEAHRRAQDEEILLSFYPLALTGENGTTSTAFTATLPDGTTNEVPLATGGANSGLNVAKLRLVQRKFLNAGVALDSEAPCLVVQSRQHDELLNEIQITSKEFNAGPVLVDGRVTRFMGINFKNVEFSSAADYPRVDEARLAASAAALQDADEVFLPCWVKSGMHFADWKMLEIDIGPRRDLRNAQQIYVTQTVGASRVQEKKVIRVRCFNA